MAEPRAEIGRFLAGTPWAGAGIVPLAGDASARRYWRLGGAVLMDHPGGSAAELRAFLNVAAHLRDLGLSAPEIYAADLSAGLIAMEDLGDAVFARVIDADASLERPLYEAALSVLARLREGATPAGLKRFSPAEMAQQAALVLDWYRLEPVSESQKMRFFAVLETVLMEAEVADQVMVLRDFHAENLIWLPERAGPARVGLLDFQDALAGPMVYDLVSLVQDARRDVPEALAEALCAQFAASAARSQDAVQRAMAAVGAQRHLRILGIFARLSRRDGKPRYVSLIRRVWRQLQSCLADPGLADLHDIVTGLLPAPTEAHLQRLRTPCPITPTR